MKPVQVWGGRKSASRREYRNSSLTEAQPSSRSNSTSSSYQYQSQSSEQDIPLCLDYPCRESPRRVSEGVVWDTMEVQTSSRNRSSSESEHAIDSLYYGTAASGPRRFSKPPYECERSAVDETSPSAVLPKTGSRSRSKSAFSLSSASSDNMMPNPSNNTSRYFRSVQKPLTLKTNVNHSAVVMTSISPQQRLSFSDRDCEMDSNRSVINLENPPAKHVPHGLTLNAQNLLYPDLDSLGQFDGDTIEFGRRDKMNQATRTQEHFNKHLSGLNQSEDSQFRDYSHIRLSHDPVESEPLDSGPHSSPPSLANEPPSSTSTSVPKSNETSSVPSTFLGFRSPFNLKKSNQIRTPPTAVPLHYSQPNISSRVTSAGLHQVKPKSSNDLESLLHAFEHKLERDNMKAKMMSVWNNIKYGWTFKGKSNIKLDSPMFLLGESYHKHSEDDDNAEDEFMKDFTSRIWFTYRSNFYPIPGSKYKTDCGWGCMLRSGQMLIAQCLVTHYLGRKWRMYDEQTSTQVAFYREIIRWFSDPVDLPSDTVPLCLHHLVQIGRNYNKDPGDWYGPASVAYILRDAVNRAGATMPVLRQLCVYVAQDCTVYIDDVNKLCRRRGKSDSYNESFEGEQSEMPSRSRSFSGSPGSWQRSLILLIPVRLGGEVMNEVYSPCIKSLLSYSHCMGIIGGKPKHSLYFIGWQEDKLVYLDPHYCRDTVDTRANNFPIETFHCMSPRKLPINRMDPSCTVGFYIKNEEEFRQFVHEVQEYISPSRQRGSYPLFIFSNGSQQEANEGNEASGIERGRVRVRHYRVDENGERQPEVVHESEDFVML